MQKRMGCTLLVGLASLATMAQAAATPVLIDFTDSRWSGATGQGSYSQTYGSLGVTLASTGGALTFNAGGPASGPSSLALHGDGIGIGDDEISWLGQSLDVIFSSGVTVLGYYLLDFFGGEGPNGTGELAQASFQTSGLGELFSDVGTAADAVGFYGREGLSVADTNRVSFSAASLAGYNGYSGFSDFAVAGILVDVGPVRVPEPGTLGLLSLGLAGLALGRRRRPARR